MVKNIYKNIDFIPGRFAMSSANKYITQCFIDKQNKVIIYD